MPGTSSDPREVGGNISLTVPSATSPGPGGLREIVNGDGERVESGKRRQWDKKSKGQTQDPTGPPLLTSVTQGLLNHKGHRLCPSL